jgi:tetratricopeptide (TPR) repeat protein
MSRCTVILLLGCALVAAQGSSVLETAAQQIARGEIREAVQTLEASLTAGEPASEEAYLRLVDCYMRLGEANTALITLEKALTSHPNSVPLLKTAGRLLLHDRQRSARAKEPLSRAVELAPNDPETHYFLSQWACLHNQEEICLEEAEKTLSMASGNAAAGLQMNTLIGVAASKLGQPEKADAAFREALAINRQTGLRDPASAFRYVDFLVRQSRNDEALPLVDEILKKAPSFGPAHLERAKALQRAGKPEEAIRLAQQALKLDGMERDNLRAAHMLLARCYFQLGDDEAAAKHQEWIEKNPH